MKSKKNYKDKFVQHELFDLSGHKKIITFYNNCQEIPKNIFTQHNSDLILFLEKNNYIKIDDRFIKPLKHIPLDIIQKDRWNIIKEYINSKNINEIICLEKFTSEISYFVPNRTFFKYCRALINVLILKEIKKEKFVILKKIPVKLESRRLFKIAYDKSWKSWFIPIEERLKNCQ